jgi:hypothetical protein
MKRALLAVILLLLPAAEAPGVKSREVPLKDIWGYGLKGTKPIAELGPPLPNGIANQNMNEIGLAIGGKVRQPAGPAFIVKGPDRMAFKSMAAKFKGERHGLRPAHEKWGQTFDSDDVWLVFYSHPSMTIELDKVKIVGKRIIVTYHFVITYQREVHHSYALIPLGKLPKGDYEVEIVRSKTVDRMGNDKESETTPRLIATVCKNGTFQIEGTK